MALMYKIIIGTNTILFIFSAVVVGISAATIYNFDSSTEAFFTRGDFAWFLCSGLIGVVISIFACMGARNPIGHYNLLFCYFFLLSVALIFNAVGFYLYRVFVLNLEASANGNVEGAVRAEAAKEFNDFLLSTYTLCCTGCDKDVVPECLETFNATRTSEGYCSPSTCEFARVCSETQLAVNEGLDQGCFINSAVIPSYEVFNNVCVFFDEFATTKKGKSIVGPVVDKGCGEGIPRVFVEDVFSFMNKNYYLIATFWGFMLVIMILAWLGSLTILLCPHRYDMAKNAI